MSKGNKTVEQKVEEASKEFSGVIDATSTFLKKIFPHAYTLVGKLRKKSAKEGDKVTPGEI